VSLKTEAILGQKGKKEKCF